ncbi:MAG: hypothetical protein IPK26_18905 [Planctomycetes bacterium]|nr:hypothetical protein [Planctomycetota bacterium]
MSRPTDELRRRLLTRSDLARLSIPASKVPSWLSRGALDLVGNYVAAGSPEDPVFAVLAADVRQELAAGLQAMGRDRVVFAPLRARSLLLRALLTERGIAVPAEIDEALVNDAPTASQSTEAELARQLLSSGLEQVLVAADDLEQAVASVLDLARREPTPESAPPCPPEGAIEALEPATTVRCHGESGESASIPAATAAIGVPIDAPADAPSPAPQPLHECERLLPATLPDDEPELGGAEAHQSVDEDASENGADWFDTEDLFGTTADWEPRTGTTEPPDAGLLAEARASIASIATTACEASSNEPIAVPTPPDPATATNATSSTLTMTEERNESEATAAAEPFQDTALAVLDDLLGGVAAAGPDAEAAIAANEPELQSSDAPVLPTAMASAPATASAGEPEMIAEAEPEAAGTAATPASPEPARTSEPVMPAAEPPVVEPTPTTATAIPTVPPIVNQVVVDMAPVERVISGLRGALEELAHRPQPSLDVQPLVAALDKSSERAADHDQAAKTTNEALQAVATELRTFGERLEKNGATTLQAIAAIQAEHASSSHEPTPFVVARASRTPFALLAVGFLLVCWATVFWFKTGNPKLALGTLVAGNLVGCCLLACRRD